MAKASAKEYRMFINGEWVGPENGKTFDDNNPFTMELFAKIPAGTREDVKKAIEAAAGAFPSWSHTPPAQRQMLFLKAADILEKRQKDILNILTEETGATFGWAMFQLGFTPGLLRESAAAVHNITGEIIPADLPGAVFMAVRQPVGVVAGIAPWNAPLILSLRAVAIPMACGNTTVLKPAGEASISGGLVLAEIFEEAGFPKGVFNVVTNSPEYSEEVGDELIANPKVRRITFTGSTETGRHLAEKAGKYLKKITLELGGKNPLIVLRDADIDYAVNSTGFGNFLHQGQICMAIGRVIVERPVVEEYTQKLVDKVQGFKAGDPRQPDTIIGPLINQRQLDKVRTLVDDAVKNGAKLLCGGKHEGLCYHPTVLADVTPKMRIYYEETFGPVASIVTVEDAEEAVRIANDTEYGLSAGIITRDFHKGWELAEQIESGIVHINDQSVHDEPQCPFGGMKASGYGRHGGHAAIEEFTELRWITIQGPPRRFPF